MSHIVLHIVFLKFAHNYYFYADALSLTSSRSGTKFATMKLSLIKCQRASMVCFRISSYAQTYIHFIRKTKLLIHTSTLAILRQEHFSYISSVLELFSLFLYCSLSFFCLLSKIGAIFLIRLLYSNSGSKQPFRFGASSPNLPALLQFQAYALFFLRASSPNPPALLQFPMSPHIARRQKPRGICHGALSTV